ncbi:hypothetical protein NDU88_003147 [Pleurodeles waltl]|uniref:Uncharacterized protein n=1 Tax=Pleurodeles waltl TaxID=8319 RepID=A0AAV7TMM0_PLEWA|nr:hypothetical protein NDU88_003147 [Pleurodeles waltl]
MHFRCKHFRCMHFRCITPLIPRQWTGTPKHESKAHCERDTRISVRQSMPPTAAREHTYRLTRAPGNPSMLYNCTRRRKTNDTLLVNRNRGESHFASPFDLRSRSAYAVRR